MSLKEHLIRIKQKVLVFLDQSETFISMFYICMFQMKIFMLDNFTASIFLVFFVCKSPQIFLLLHLLLLLLQADQSSVELRERSEEVGMS